MPTIITICETCKREDWKEKGLKESDGFELAQLIEKSSVTEEKVITRRHSCLMGCDHGCNVTIQDNKKLSYVLGNFKPTSEDAEAIILYANLHANSTNGQVPYREWPQAIKGHFVARIPPIKDN
ncbi:MAG: hypothetical protein CML34_03620 [Rhodobacteraceae bacterium]|jgi:predicted metal-binding protein|nr:hypothetical protein [Paracoccaceae bacterium]MAT01163.1 hypothetical protein [Paracoccaceae bacterium]MBL6855108.1 DUF1636 domain-containing protein [Paracoccaceae bacterium]MBV04194.1 hypothetical protein [Paracoccaceae bacterium]MDG1880242.1 DUF1636 domain-containing protein [Paracoccaceae bacterium]|tara:strand:+ start:2448 stop:2819 length:372 start_codon:yes stop_codon:yes gene_type:complete